MREGQHTLRCLLDQVFRAKVCTEQTSNAAPSLCLAPRFMCQSEKERQSESDRKLEIEYARFFFCFPFFFVYPVNLARGYLDMDLK